MGENNRRDPVPGAIKIQLPAIEPVTDPEQQRDTSAAVAEEEYILSDADREAIAMFDFRIRNVFVPFLFLVDQKLRTDPNNPELSRQLKEFKAFFQDRIIATEDAIPLLQASANADVRALATLLPEASVYFINICGAISMYETQRDPIIFSDTVHDNHRKMDAISSKVAQNQAYRAYKKYIKVNDLEAGRTTIHLGAVE